MLMPGKLRLWPYLGVEPVQSRGSLVRTRSQKEAIANTIASTSIIHNTASEVNGNQKFIEERVKTLKESEDPAAFAVH